MSSDLNDTPWFARYIRGDDAITPNVLCPMPDPTLSAEEAARYLHADLDGLDLEGLRTRKVLVALARWRVDPESNYGRWLAARAVRIDDALFALEERL